MGPSAAAGFKTRGGSHIRADRNEYVEHEVSAFLKTGGRTRYGEQGLSIVLFLIVAVFWLEQLPPRSVNVKGAVAGLSQFHPIPEEQYGRRLRVDISSARKANVIFGIRIPTPVHKSDAVTFEKTTYIEGDTLKIILSSKSGNVKGIHTMYIHRYQRMM